MEWLETHGFKRLVGRMATTGLLEVVATATPGIKDLLSSAASRPSKKRRVRPHRHRCSRRRARRRLPSLPAGVRDAAKTGVLHRQAVEVLEMIGDPDRCTVMLVTIPEETPVNEMIETSFAIEEDLGVHLGPAVVNSVLPDLDDLDRDLATLAAESASTSPTTSAPPSPPPPVSALVDSVSNARTARRLGAVLPLDQIRLHIASVRRSGPARSPNSPPCSSPPSKHSPRRATSDSFAELLAESQVVICCGTGGVGKTTTSAATALAAATAGAAPVW